jgi:transposase
LDQGGVAAHQKKTRCLRAILVFLDESGLLMAPLVRRTWAPTGKTPCLFQRTRAHEKVSVIAALCISPARETVRLYFRLHPDKNIRTVLVIDFLVNLMLHCRGSIILVWDRLQVHRSKKVQRFLGESHRIRSFYLPPYAPELNPVEYVWGYLKRNPLANVAMSDSKALGRVARSRGRSLQKKDRLLRSFITHSPLPLRLK